MGEALAPAIEAASSLFSGGGELAAGAAEAGAGDLASLVGTGEGLFGGATGLEGTALAGGFGGDLGALTTTAGLGAAGTAADFMAAGGATGGGGFNAAADTALSSAAATGAPSGLGGISGTPSIADFTPAGIGGVTTSGLSPNVANANAGVQPKSVFDTGTSGITGANASGQPSAVPAGNSASSVAAPSGVSAPADPTAAASGTAAAVAKPEASSIGSLVKGATDSLTKNPLGIALGAGGLGYNILQGQKQTANQNALTADAKQATANSNRLTASGEDLQKYLTNGTLPPNYQAQVDQAINDAKTQAISNAAAQGLPTDPTQNTALAATLAKIDSSRAGMQAQVAQTLFSSGSSLVSAGQSSAGLSGDLFKTLVNNDTASAANTGKAIATLAAAMNGKAQAQAGGQTITIG